MNTRNSYYQSTEKPFVSNDGYSKDNKKAKSVRLESRCITIIVCLCIGIATVTYFRKFPQTVSKTAFYGYVPLDIELKTELILSPKPSHFETLPNSFSWNDVDGKNFLTASHAQHQPYSYCGACWIFGSVAVIDDRLNIQDPEGHTFSGSHQALINCGPNYENGCGGGDANAVFKWVHEHGLPETSCNNYLARNNKCDALGRCQDCAPGGICSEKPRGTYTIAVVDEYGSIDPPQGSNLQDPLVIRNQVQRMKAEIHKRGPIACGIICTDKMVAYTPLHPKTVSEAPYAPHVMTFDAYGNSCKNDNIAHSNDDIMSCIDHIVEVVGWGMEQNTEYWLIRNSWGTWWGENGFFRVEVGKMTLGIESGCDWAVPRVIRSNDDLMKFEASKGL